MVIARNRLKLEQLRGSVFQYIPALKYIPIFLTLSEGGLKHSLIPQLLSCISTVDILINNAGALVNKPFEEIGQEEVEKIFKVNIIFTFRTNTSSIFRIWVKVKNLHIL